MKRGKSRPEDPDIVVDGDLDWLLTLGGISGEVLLWVRMVQGVFRREYVHSLHRGADEDTMRRVDQALLRHFGAQVSY